MRTRGRPRITQVQLKNGFYIEVCNKGIKRGVKIWSDSKKGMEDTATLYAGYKDVIILGEYKSGVPFIEEAVSV
jgi:hypothetical protein